MSGSARPSLMVSIHDVSPLTWVESRRAVELAQCCGIPLQALTVLVIPEHEGSFELVGYPAFVDWLKELSRGGATLVAHGLTHRMSGSVGSLTQLAWAYGFAAGQAEFYNIGRDRARELLARVKAAFEAVGLGEALSGFVPPAWLLSRAARDELAVWGAAYLESMRGIELGAHLFSSRLIGWGARSVIESLLTAFHAELQCLRQVADTRLAVHPRDMTSRVCVRSIARALRRLGPRTEPLSYARYLSRVVASG